jgi:hypothetical protein
VDFYSAIQYVLFAVIVTALVKPMGAPETKNHVSSGAQTNRCSPAHALGEMEGRRDAASKPIRAAFSTLPFTDISFSR